MLDDEIFCEAIIWKIAESIQKEVDKLYQN